VNSAGREGVFVSFIRCGVALSHTWRQNQGAPGVGRRALGAGVLCALVSGTALAHAQEARWDQLSSQVVELMNQDKAQQALPLAQQALQVAQATWGPADKHVAVTAAVLANLNLELERLGDAEGNLKQALAIYTKLEGPGGRETANALSNLGNVYLKEANYQAAEQVTRQALAANVQLQGESSDAVATDESNLAIIYTDEDKYADAESLYKKSIATYEKLGKFTSAATSLSALGTLYGHMHRFADAEQACSQAVAFDLKAPASEHPDTGLDLNNLGAILTTEGKFAQAEQAYSKGMAFEQQASTPNQAAIAGIEQNAGALLRDEGKYPQAQNLLLQALASRTKVLGPNHPEVASILIDLGGLFEFETRYSDADRAYQQAIAIDLKSLGPQSLETANAIQRLAELHGSYGDYGAADKLYHDAIPVYWKVFGQTNDRMAEVSLRYAEILRREQKYDDAVKIATAAAAIYQKLDGDSSGGYASCLDFLAAIAEDGRNHDLSEKLHKQALAVHEKIDGPDSRSVADSLEGLARVYKDEQKFADAEPLLLRQLKIEKAHATAPHSAGVEAAEADLASLYYAWAKPQQAAPYFQMYLGDYEDELRANAATMSERSRLLYFAEYRGAFPMFFSFVSLFYKQMPELAGQMYDVILQEKGMIAESSAAMRAAVVASGDPQAVQMLDKLASDKAQLAALAESTVGDPANYQKQMNDLAGEANTLEAELSKRSAVLSRQKVQNAATWQDVQKTLKPGEAAVEFVRFQFHTGIEPLANIGYVALVLTPESKQPELVLLGEGKDLEAGPMLAYREDVGQTRGFEEEAAPAAAGQQGTVANTSAAYAGFWKPLEPALGGAKRVYVSPDGVLTTIPIGLMADSDGKLLMEKVQLRIVNSTKDLLLPARLVQSKSALLVGNPKFDLSAAQQKTAIAELRGGAVGAGTQQTVQSAQISNAGAAQTASRGGDLKGGDLNPLPGTQVEVDTVDKLLKTASWQANEYTGELALKDTVTEARAPRLVHIATHGFFLSDEQLQANAAAEGTTANVNEDPMLRAGLFFAGADRVRQGAAPEAGVDDGVLTAYEASQLNLQGTELVVLSACETGLGKDLNIDGIFGLRRGLQEAGADALLMSMWSVPDKETQELMALFYQKWLSGMEKPEALRQAQLEERETVKKRYGKDLPFYWGAFVLVGR
jgi:CHAT domain-containing protein